MNIVLIFGLCILNCIYSAPLTYIIDNHFHYSTFTFTKVPDTAEYECNSPEYGTLRTPGNSFLPIIQANDKTWLLFITDYKDCTDGISKYNRYQHLCRMRSCGDALTAQREREIQECYYTLIATLDKPFLEIDIYAEQKIDIPSILQYHKAQAICPKFCSSLEITVNLCMLHSKITVNYKKYVVLAEKAQESKRKYLVRSANWDQKPQPKLVSLYDPAKYTADYDPISCTTSQFGNDDKSLDCLHHQEIGIGLKPLDQTTYSSLKKEPNALMRKLVIAQDNTIRAFSTNEVEYDLITAHLDTEQSASPALDESIVCTCASKQEDELDGYSSRVSHWSSTMSDEKRRELLAIYERNRRSDQVYAARASELDAAVYAARASEASLSYRQTTSLFSTEALLQRFFNTLGQFFSFNRRAASDDLSDLYPV